MAPPKTQAITAPPRPRSGLVRAFLAALRSPLGATSLALIALLAILAVIGPIVWGEQAGAIDTAAILQAASPQHWFGTDGLGRDLFARTVVSVRLSLLLAIAATAIGLAAGLVLGTLPWFLPPRAGRIVVSVINVAIAFPSLLLVLFFAIILGVGVAGAVFAVGLAIAPYFARLTHTLVSGVREREYIAAARITGSSRFAILVRHILPNIGETLVVNGMTTTGGALVAFAGLSFLGIGIQAPAYDLGVILNEGYRSIYVNPAAALGPAGFVIAAGIAFSLAGETLAKQIGLRADLVARAVVPTTKPVSPRTATGGVVLEVRGLTVEVAGAAGIVRPVRDLDFTISRGEAVGVVGESGSGKSLTALAVAGLLEAPVAVEAERIEFLGRDVREVGSNDVTRHTLATSFGMVFQDPTTSLNPTIRIGRQLAEVTQVNGVLGARASWARAIERLRSVRVPAAERRARQFPHEFSGGMRQRAMIAMAIMGEPALIVADEPTTALDVTVERQVLAVLQRARREGDAAILFISHDITIVGKMCDRVLVMYAGRIVEDLPAAELRTAARHPYTRLLQATIPDMRVDRAKPLATIPGRPVDPANRPQGCAFAPRCPLATDLCRSEDPPLVSDGRGRRVACWRADEPLPPDSHRTASFGPELTVRSR